ncbi:hypothetical protein LENED_004976 [Lentinula edodes]|uniref:Uncharacterized protein n=1 Tax=Lentinula edodes TaxID=5353 RepID=A0A1Q3E7P3_LENED|nr:hypothetical protein LENED_004976 [Lentinula edodes]
MDGWLEKSNFGWPKVEWTLLLLVFTGRTLDDCVGYRSFSLYALRRQYPEPLVVFLSFPMLQRLKAPKVHFHLAIICHQYIYIPSRGSPGNAHPATTKQSPPIGMASCHDAPECVTLDPFIDPEAVYTFNRPRKGG